VKGSDRSQGRLKMKAQKVQLIIELEGSELVNAIVSKSAAIKIAKEYEKFFDINSKKIIEQLKQVA
jgi:hypothetical protein